MKRKLKLAFIYPKRFAFYPPDYVGRGLGGSESALVLLSRALAARGHQVEVFNCCYKPGLYEGVKWKFLWSFNPRRQFDAVISLRLLEPFDLAITAPIRALWMHDDTLPGATQADEQGRVNVWIAVSQTQRKCIEKTERIPAHHWFLSKNALDEAIYNDELKKTKKHPGQAIYCSAPDRGLICLLHLWPRIQKAVPWAQLVITGSHALWGTSDAENDRMFDWIYRRAAAMKNVTLLKRVSKLELARLQAESELMLYPTLFDEMFCISALECLSVGTPVISSRRAAMIERVDHSCSGFLVAGPPESSQYQEQFVSYTAMLFQNGQARAQFAHAGIFATRPFTYTRLAEEWETEFLHYLRSNGEGHPLSNGNLKEH
jgi:hypothetical protein